MKEPRPLYCLGATVNMFFRSHFSESAVRIDSTQFKLCDSSLTCAFIRMSLNDRVVSIQRRTCVY